MVEFNLQEFVSLVREYLYGFFPYEDDATVEKKHAKRPLHIRDIAFMYLPVNMSGENAMTFDIGSDYAEEQYPYYHILQDAQIIHKRNKGTARSKGSQAQISKVSSRDYGRVRFNGKTYSREYAKNVRGERAKIVDKSTRYTFKNGEKVKINGDATTYVNVHYKYIDKILDYSLPFIADYFGMKLKRKQDTGLSEEYNSQQADDFKNVGVGNWDLDMYDIMNSFSEED